MTIKCTYDNRTWNMLGFIDKLKYSLAAVLILSSIILGFVSFAILLEIPTSVLGLDGLWLSSALAIFGITSYFANEMSNIRTEINTKLTKNGEEDKEL